MAETVRNFIGGRWVPAARGRTFPSVDPSTGEVLAHAQASGAEDVRDAVAAARAAAPGWRRCTAFERGEVLRRAADVLASRSEEIARTMASEMGKPIGEARGEVDRGVVILRYYAGEGLRPVGEVIPSMLPGTLLYTTRSPLGVVGVITPWNFPVAIPLWKMAPALVYGNTVVWKPASDSALTAVRLAEVFEAAGLPQGVLNLVTGSGREVGEALTDHPDVDGITFTGSNEVGRGIGARAAARGAKFQLEMGGKNAVIVAEDADLDQAVELTVSGAMRLAGQKCTATSRAIVVHKVYDEFRERLAARVAALPVGPALEEATYVGPLVSAGQARRVLQMVERAKAAGARLVVGGRTPDSAPTPAFVEPTVFDGVSPEMEIAQEEVFGPVVALLPARDLEEAVGIANRVRYGLSAAIFTRDVNRVLRFAESIEAGVVKVNAETAGVEPQAPFGGMKDSSSHSREQGRAALEFFTNVKTVSVSPAKG
jgi:acyl-CoA reductase-like NAD-dependent aldehyde dehydrogenase